MTQETHNCGPNPSGVCMCGCGRATPVAEQNRPYRGWIKGKPVKFLPHHHARLERGPRKIHFIIDPGTGCWEWQLSKTHQGYGQVTCGKSGSKPHMLAHRYYYELYKGTIPEDMQLDHLCSNRACVNPYHLEPVSNATNSRRSKRAKIGYIEAHEIRALGAMPGGLLLEDIAGIYGLSPSHISRIVNGIRWGETESIS